MAARRRDLQQRLRAYPLRSFVIDGELWHVMTRACQPGAHFFGLRSRVAAENGLVTRTSIACCCFEGPDCFSVQSCRRSNLAAISANMRLGSSPLMLSQISRISSAQYFQDLALYLDISNARWGASDRLETRLSLPFFELI